MPIFNWFRRKGVEKKQGYQNSGPANGGDVSVNFDNAMQVSACWAATRLLSETVASMPLKCYRKDGDTRVVDENYPLWTKLNFAPNRYQTRVEFFETLMLNLCTRGNAYFYVNGNERRSRINAFQPLMASQTVPYLARDGSLKYEYIDQNGTKRVFSEREIWHVKLFGNGLEGLSPLSYASQSLGTAIVQDQRNRRLSKNGGKTAGFVTHEGPLTNEQREAVRKELQGMVSGDSDFLPVFEMGGKFTPTSLSPDDVKLLESRRFSIEDIARFMGVPSVLINDTSGSTVWGSGIGQLVEGFYKLNLKPYLERIEASIKRHLMSPAEWAKYDIEFDFDSLLRADLKTRIETFARGVNSGLFTPNEGRADLGRPPKPNGDDIYLNGSLVKAGTERAQPEPPQPQEPKEEKEENEQD